MHRETTKSLDKFFLVSNQPLFKSLSDKDKAFVANRSQVVECNKNDVIYREGHKKDFLYIVISGEILLFHPASLAASKKETSLEILRKGDYFGIISLLTGRPHSLSARVIRDARILRIEEKSFRQILNKIPHLAIEISRALSRRLKREYKGIKEIFQSTVISVYYEGDSSYSTLYCLRLAKGIEKESGKKTIVLSINKKIPKDFDKKNVELKSVYIDRSKGISPILSNFTANHHFVILDLPKDNHFFIKNILKSSDTSHLMCDHSLKSVKKMSLLIRKMGKEVPQDFFKIIIKEDKDPRFSLKAEKILNSRIYATLPSEEKSFTKAMRRISRQTSGVLMGIALGSGGAIGFAQVGVLKVLESENIPIDIIAGTSIGALIGALWAVGYNSEEITKICMQFNTKLKTLSLIDVTFPRQGLLAGRRVKEFLSRYLKNKTFYDIKLPLKIVACDIKKRQEVIISSGKLIDAVMASISIPGLFNPVATKDGRLLVDGGIVTPLPISVLTKIGVKRIIAVNSLPSPEDIIKADSRRHSIVDIMVNSIYSMEYRIAKYACQDADIYIHPILKNSTWYEFYKAREFIDVGKRHTRLMLPRIKALVK